MPERSQRRGQRDAAKREPEPPTPVVDLASERGRRKLRGYENRIRRVLAVNRLAVTRLFGSGLLFTRQGTRAGRELLLAHQHLLKVVDVLDDLAGLDGAESRPGVAVAMYEELDALLTRTSQLSARTEEFLAGL